MRNQIISIIHYINCLIIMSAKLLSDEAVYEVTCLLYNQFSAEERANRLDLDHLDQFKAQQIKPLYPHKEIVENNRMRIQKYTCQEYCCELNPGKFWCCKATPPDNEYRAFGLGVCLYVKFLKHFLWFLLPVSILAVLSILLYYLVGLKSGYPVLSNYQNFIFSGTVGILSSGYMQCQYNQISATNTVSFLLECPVGQINLLGPVLSSKTLNTLQNCRVQIEKIQSKIYNPSAIESRQCSNDLSQCSISLQLGATDYQGVNYEYVSYAYECQNSIYQLGTIPFTSSIIMYTTVGIDLAIMILFFFFMCSQDQAEKDQIYYFKTRELAINDFSLKISGFSLSNFENQFDHFIASFKLKKEEYSKEEDILYNIVQIKIPDTHEMRKAIENRRQCYNEMFDLIDHCFFDELIDPNRFGGHEEFIKKCYGNSAAQEYVEYKKLLSEATEKFLKSKQANLAHQKDMKISIYMVLNSLRQKRAFFKISKIRCFKRILQTSSGSYKIEEPPVADMIIWGNQYKWTFVRMIIVWIITLAICFCSYLLVGVAQYQKQKLMMNNQFDQDCSVIYTNDDLKAWSATLSSQSNYLNCYCSYHYFNFDFSSAQITSACSSWVSAYATYFAIPILISLGIVLYNLLVSRIFRILTKFEGHSELTSELYSYIIKRVFVLVLNMGLIIILLKLEYKTVWNDPNLYFLFQGTYQDVTSDWYLDIGTIITLTLCFNIFLPLFEMFFLSLIKVLKKCWDRRCYCRKTSQKTKKGYLKLYANDVFPIEERYADLIAVFIITLAFSAAIPGLYIIALFSYLCMAISDKPLLFKLYQKPINYTEKLQSKVFKILYFSLMVHCVISAIMLSEPNLMIAGSQIQTSILETSNKRLNNIIQTPYLMAYVIIFIILAVWAVLHTTLVRLFQYCYEKCKKSVSFIHSRKLNQNFFESLNQYQINRLKMSIQRQLNQNITHNFSRDQVRLSQQLNDTEANLFGELKKHMTVEIGENTLRRLKDMQRNPEKYQLNDKNRAKLIGRAGYEQIFDDNVFNRERNIKLLDLHLSKVLGNQRRYESRSKEVAITDLHH